MIWLRRHRSWLVWLLQLVPMLWLAYASAFRSVNFFLQSFLLLAMWLVWLVLLIKLGQSRKSLALIAPLLSCPIGIGSAIATNYATQVLEKISVHAWRRELDQFADGVVSEDLVKPRKCIGPFVFERVDRKGENVILYYPENEYGEQRGLLRIRGVAGELPVTHSKLEDDWHDVWSDS